MTNAELISRNYRPSAPHEHACSKRPLRRPNTQSPGRISPNSVFRRIGLSRIESAQLVEAVIEEISDAILRGENVKLSSFGTFLQRSKRERIGRNPKTGVEATITPRKVLVFKRIAHHARPDQRQRSPTESAVTRPELSQAPLRQSSLHGAEQTS